MGDDTSVKKISENMFHSAEFMFDVPGKIVENLISKATMHTHEGSYFCWKRVDFQCIQ